MGPTHYVDNLRWLKTSPFTVVSLIGKLTGFKMCLNRLWKDIENSVLTGTYQQKTKNRKYQNKVQKEAHLVFFSEFWWDF